MEPLGIKAFVDFAFKKIFGSPENSAALIGLLNAILELRHPIKDVTILNPFSFQEFQTAKLVVLDVKAQDSVGRLFNVEMQISIHPGMLSRMVFYASEMYTDQLASGDDYSKLNTTISICLLTGNLFQDSEQVHHRFQMMDEKSGRKLDRAIEVHTVELSKSGCDRWSVSGANRLAQWCWLILNAHECTAEELRELFPDLEFQPVIGCLEIISFKTEDKAMHDQREKAQRDYDWMLSTARRQGLEEGIERGIEQGIVQGIEQGREEGTIFGAIQALQQILGDVVSSSHELSSRSDVELKTQLAELQDRVRSRLN
ncbi:MAG: Rpn family recombination-promoting nuclease/putative transposase [Planctomyces sp.]|nr:Rpn family recombination-promoting nuclease/putative transposase [Planctomyces sp.]